MQVKSRQFPNWTSGAVLEARYAEKVETFTVQRTGEKIPVLRFILKVRRNDGGVYERNFLYSNKLPTPLSHESWYGGPLEWTRLVVEYK